MDASRLRDYTNWERKSPEVILASVRAAGGWITVFPGELPKWAHRVRNFFNREPIALMRFGLKATESYMARVESALNLLQRQKQIKSLKRSPIFGSWPAVALQPDPPPGTPDADLKENIGEKMALSGSVYMDEHGRVWYQMGVGATIYHWGKTPSHPGPEAIWTTVSRNQMLIPIFKLVAPDGTGGSHETIVKNPFTQTVDYMGQKLKVGRLAIGDANKFEPVMNLVVSDVALKGSYNYSETVVTGLANHEKRDVRPHEKYHDVRDIYVNPPSPFVPLFIRVFPKTAPNESEPLAKQL